MKRCFRFLAILLFAFFMLPVGGRIIQVTAADRMQFQADRIYTEYSASVFYLRVLKPDGSLKTTGSGFLTGGGRALTAYHVVSGGSAFEAVFDDGAIVKNIKISKTDSGKDLALLELDSGDRPGLAVESTAARHGQKVLAMGYPLKETKIITEGMVNTPRAVINGQERLLTSAQVAGGMSGGPLLNSYGQVVGLISGSLRNMSNIHICVDAEDIEELIKGK